MGVLVDGSAVGLLLPNRPGAYPFRVAGREGVIALERRPKGRMLYVQLRCAGELIPPLEKALELLAPPAGARCVEHSDQAASLVCARCGAFACAACSGTDAMHCRACLERLREESPFVAYWAIPPIAPVLALGVGWAFGLFSTGHLAAGLAVGATLGLGSRLLVGAVLRQVRTRRQVLALNSLYAASPGVVFLILWLLFGAS